MVPKVREYLEARHDVWDFFFPSHYQVTQQLRKTDLSAFPPLPGYVFAEDDVAQQDVAQEQYREEEQGQRYIGGDDDEGEEEEEEEGGGEVEVYVEDGNTTGAVIAPGEPMFGNAASNDMARKGWWEAHLANLDHLHNCLIADTCDVCKNIYKDIDFQGNFNHTLGECPGKQCGYCKREQETADWVKKILA